MKCLLCNGEYKELWSSSYDEPPEGKSQCDTCGLTNYYSYYEGEFFYLEGFVLKEDQNYYSEVRHLLLEENDFPSVQASMEEYVQLLNAQIEKKTISLEDIKKSRKDKKLYLQKEKQKAEKLKAEEQERWINEEYNEKETEIIQKFVDEQNLLISKLESLGVIINVESITSQFGFQKSVGDFNSQRLMEYISNKVQMQKKCAQSIQAPVFAPTICYNCSSNIYGVSMSSKTLFGKTYPMVSEFISPEQCSSRLITGCPKCSRTFVD